SQVKLVQVEHANLFLVSLDDERHWYRYHHLFAEVLRSRLQQRQPTVVPELHRRASRWYEHHELFDEAVTHALAVPDVERAARLFEQYAHLTNFSRQYHILHGWLTRILVPLLSTSTTLCIMNTLI